MRGDIRDVVERIMQREHPQLWNDLPPRVREAVHERVQQQLPDDRPRGHGRDRRQHRPAARREADGDPADRGAARALQPHLPRGRAEGAPLHHQLRLLLRLRARHPDGDPHRGRVPRLVAAADLRRADRLRHELARALDDLRAGRAAEAVRPLHDPRPVHPPPARGRRRLRGDHRRRHRHRAEHRRRSCCTARARTARAR